MTHPREQPDDREVGRILHVVGFGPDSHDEQGEPLWFSDYGKAALLAAFRAGWTSGRLALSAERPELDGQP